MNTVQMWVEGVGKRNLSIWCFNCCGWPPAGYKILQALHQGSQTQITWGPLSRLLFSGPGEQQIIQIKVNIKIKVMNKRFI